jgi:predicted DCC family thiol-disulfide oxidoreductase YuxK
MICRVLATRRSASFCRPARRLTAFQYSSSPGAPNGQKDHYYDRRDRLGKVDDDFGDEASFTRFSQNIMAKKEETHRIEWTTQDNFLTVFYDGGCSLCRTEINFYKRLQQKQLDPALGDTQHKDFIDFYNIYEKPVHPELIRRNISYVDTQKRIHALTADGEIIHGFSTFLEIWKRLPYWKYLYVVCSIQPVPFIGEKVYSFWAKRRYDKRKNDIEKDSKCAL